MIKILNKELKIPIIQGGMGVGVSLGNLAGNVAACGAMGVISTVNAGYREPDFNKSPLTANLRALRNEIKKAFDIAKDKGLIAINAMVAVNHYEETVKAAVEAGVNAILSGAGLPLQLPKYTKGTNTAAAPIVSSGKAAQVICKAWDKKYEVIPDFIVIEGAKAGGHLGFDKDDLCMNRTTPLKQILKDVLEEIKPFEEKYLRKIPVFVAGGIFDGKDMAEMINAGASGVQIATRFIATDECDASDGYKNVIINAKDKDTTIIKSPVGMPGRALKSTLIRRIEEGQKYPPELCNDCLKTCPHGIKTPYCISRALIEAVKGNEEQGLFFCGANVGRVNEKVPVKNLISEIVNDWRKYS